MVEAVEVSNSVWTQLTITSEAGDDHLVLQSPVIPQGGELAIEIVDSEGNTFVRRETARARIAVRLPYRGEGFTARLTTPRPLLAWPITAQFEDLTDEDNGLLMGGGEY